jgi:hypothetical protein
MRFAQQHPAVGIIVEVRRSDVSVGLQKVGDRADCDSRSALGNVAPTQITREVVWDSIIATPMNSWHSGSFAVTSLDF